MGHGLTGRGGSHGVNEDRFIVGDRDRDSGLRHTGAAQIWPTARNSRRSRTPASFLPRVLVAAKDGMVYVSDLTRTALVKDDNPGGTIYRFDTATKQTTKFMEPAACRTASMSTRTTT